MTEREKSLWQQYTKNRERHAEYAFDFEKTGRLPMSAIELNFLAFAVKETIASVMEGKVKVPTEAALEKIERVAVGEPICRFLAAVDQINTEAPGQMFEFRKIDV